MTVFDSSHQEDFQTPKNLKYLSQNFIKFKDQGQFWNPHDVQIPKLSLGVQFDQEIMEKTWEISFCKLNHADCIWFRFRKFMVHINLSVIFIEAFFQTAG